MEGLDLEIFPTEKLEKELAESKRAVKELRLQVKGLNILLAQNAALEQVTKLSFRAHLWTFSLITSIITIITIRKLPDFARNWTKLPKAS